MTIQTRQIYGLQHANTNEWYRVGLRVQTFPTQARAASFRKQHNLTAKIWVAKQLIEKLERAE